MNETSLLQLEGHDILMIDVNPTACASRAPSDPKLTGSATHT